MSDFDRTYARTVPVGAADMSVDVGLRRFMLGVYNKLALGLVVSAALAWATGYGPLKQFMFAETPSGTTYSLLGMAVAFAPLGILLFSAFLMRSMSPRTAGIMYWTIVSLIGASLGIVLLMYTGASVFSTFLVTATAFGGLSLIGYTTKKNLTAMGSFLIMGVIGLLLASVVNMFMQSGMMQFIISAAGVLIFSGLIAYDTQRLKLSYYEMGGDQAQMAVATNLGALSLYLDFINLFRFLLFFLGASRE